jgi:Flp pilus assembly pilin Flp
MQHIRMFLSCESGATSIEYVLIAATIGLGILTGAQSVKDAVNTYYGTVSTGVAAIP